MKKKSLFGFCLLGVVAAGVPALNVFADEKPAAAEAKDGFVSLFNGKDLDGWRGKEGFWSVQDGALTGETKEAYAGPNTFLIHKDEVTDFELRSKYRIYGGNSGVQYRSKVIGEEHFQVGGYQADFEAGETFSGILYDEGGVAGGKGVAAGRSEKVHFKADGTREVTGNTGKTSEELQKAIKAGDEWNEYEIIAKGNHLVHKINGNTTIEVTDDTDKALKTGVLAIQVHAGGPMKVQVKDVMIKKL